MRFKCQHCNHIIQVPNSDAGKRMGCTQCGNITVVPPTRLSPNTVINDFLIKGVLGVGGMGTVYLAQQLSLDRPVALKILKDQYARDSNFILDFVREARGAAKLNHPNIVQAYAVGEEDGVYFFAMEFIEGQTLKQILNKEGPLDWRRVFHIGMQIGEALDFAWKNQQLVHRDIKPDNIMITNRGVAKLADLGLARAATELIDHEDEEEIMGTPQYICPEQLLGQPMDVRGDLYSLGATMFHVISGKFPYDGNSAAEIAKKHLSAKVPDIREFVPNVPETASYVLKKMMAKRIEDRYDDAERLVKDIALVLRGEKPVGFQPEGPLQKNGSSGKTSRQKAAGSSRNLKNVPSSIGGSVQGSVDRQSPTYLSSPAGKKASSSGRMFVAVQPSTNSETGGYSMSDTERSRSKKLKSTRITGTQTGIGSGVYVPPGLEQRKVKIKITPGMVIAFLFFVLFSILFVWCLNTYMKYNYRSPQEALRGYLEAISREERNDYEAVAIFFDGKYDDDRAEEVLKRADHFLTTYPGSLFSRNPSVPITPKTYAQLYRIPLELSAFAQNIHPMAKKHIGAVLLFRDNMAIPRYIRVLRKKQIGEEDQQIELREAKYNFDQKKEQVWQQMERYADSLVGEYRTKLNTLQSQLDNNKERFEQEKKDVLKQLLNILSVLDFEAAWQYFRTAASPETQQANYPRTVTVEAKATAAEDYVKKAADRLAQYRREFIGLEKGGTVTITELEQSFTRFCQNKGIDGIYSRLRSLPVDESQLFRTRETWFKNIEEALNFAQKYHTLVANTGGKFGPGWDPIQGIRNRSNIAYFLQNAGWFPRQITPQPGDQVWIMAISASKIVTQVRRYTKDGNVLPVGVEEIPLWEAVLTEVFSYLASQPQVKSLLGGEFEVSQACHDFFVRPSLFKKYLEKGIGHPIIDFLKNEVPNALSVWEPQWIQECLSRLEQIMKVSPFPARKMYFTHYHDVLEPLKLFQDRKGELEGLLNPSR